MPPRRSLLPREPLLRVALLPPPTPPPDDDEGDTAQPAAPAEPPPAPALPPPAPIGRILEQARPEAATLACACVFLAAGAALNLALPYLAGQLIDACSGAATSKADPPAGGGGGGGDWDPAAAVQRINQLLLRLVAVVAAGAVTGATRSYLFNAAAERIVARLRARLFRQVISQEVGFFDAARSGELLSRLSEDVRAMRDAATSTLSSALSSGATVAAGIALMGATSWRLTLCVLCTLPVPIGALIAFARANRAVMVKQLAASAAASAAAEEALGALRTVRSFAQEDAVAARYSARLRETLRQGLRGAAIGAALSGVVGPLTTGSLVFVLWVGARQVIAGTLSVGELNSFMLYALYVGASAGALGGVFAQLTTAAGAGARVFELLDRTPLLPPSGSEAPAAAPGGGASLALKRVWFSYPSRPSVWVLRGFDLAIAPRQRVALVGSSGGGKSTVAALVQRYYDPARGEVLLDGAPVRLWDHRALHRAVAMVAQEPTLFAESILYNIIFPYLAVDGAAVWSSGGGGGGGGAQAAAKRWSGWRRPRGDGGAKAGGAAALAAPGADEEQPLLPGEAVASSANGGGAADGESHPPAAAAAHSAGAAVPGLDASLLAQLAPGLSVEDVVAAAKAAHAHDFICALPEGYSTPVGERGVRLSGGQKQRVAIARALLLRPRLLLLDEATSALDAESEHQVQAALDEAAQGRSVLVIAHRLSTVRDADAVAVVAGGRVEELGTHTELLAKGGAYAALVRRQLLGSGADAGGGTGGGGTHGGAAVAQHSSAGGGGGGENGSSDVGVVDTPAV